MHQGLTELRDSERRTPRDFALAVAHLQTELDAFVAAEVEGETSPVRQESMREGEVELF
jgi:hypothetical protein